MYALLALSTVIRITAAFLLLFVAVPSLASRKPAALDRWEWFWWNLGIGVVALTLVGQLLSLARIASSVSYLILIVVLILLLRARSRGVPASRLIAHCYSTTVRYALHALERRVSMRRRARRLRRHLRARVTTLLESRETRRSLVVWSIVIIAAAVTRLARPFASANLGFSDTYGHFYLLRLLEEGRQVDPAWGPYPRGMHFLLLTIERLTGVEPILLMNFFGAFAGILITLAVADAARRLSGHILGALIGGLLFATMLGGPTQYFSLGGVFLTDDRNAAKAFLRLPYENVPSTAGEFDLLLTAFQRQTVTLPQELAVVFLFPAAMFLLGWFRSGSGWHLSGLAGCSAAIAAIHPGVAVPLVILCAIGAAAAGCQGILTRRKLTRAAMSGLVAIIVGSTWMIAYFAYPSIGAESTISTRSTTGVSALYFFPFLRSLHEGGGDLAVLQTVGTYAALTGLLMVCVVAALLLIVHALWRRNSRTMDVLWIAGSFLIFAATHASAFLHLPALVEVRRNTLWLAMSLAALVAVAVVALVSFLRHKRPSALPRWAVVAPAVVVLLLWSVRVPNLFGSGFRARIIDYSGYGAVTYSLIRINRQFEPFSWTLVSYGQEYPMVLGRGFHVPAVDFLDRYDPTAPLLAIPTRYVFIAVEKKPHQFEVSNWSARFSRAALQERLQTWCTLYGIQHDDMRIFFEDDDVRVFAIERSEEEAARIAKQLDAK